VFSGDPGGQNVPETMKLQLANQFLQMGRLDQAEALYRQILAAEPDNAAATASLGMIYRTQEKHDLAIRHLEKAIELQPDDLQAQVKLADSLRDIGRLEEARNHYQHVLEAQPRNPQALVPLALINRNTEYSDDIRWLETLHAHPDLPRAHHRRLAFTLGKVFDDLEQYDKAFGYLAEGNRMAHEDHPSTLRDEARRYERIRTLCNADFLRHCRNAAVPGRGIILITGMPRSGSSLVEQILASHPDVHGAGEVECFHRLVLATNRKFGLRFPAGFETLDKQHLRALATRYSADLHALAEREHYVTDKNMGSILYIGLIGSILPDARIIHCRRDPKDQGLSFFQQDFLHYQPNSYDLGEIGQYHQIRQALMDHWAGLMPGRMYEIHYEDLVEDMEHQTRGLLEHCGLPFDPACLAFHQTERTVYTASLAQVRRPLYNSSVGRWKHYRNHLRPLIAALEKDPSACLADLSKPQQAL